MINLFPTDRWYFTIWLYTYEHFYDYPERLIEFMETSFQIADPFAQRLSLAATKLDTFKEVRKRFDPDGWSWCKTAIENRDLASFFVYNPRGLFPLKRVVPNWHINVIHLRPSQISHIQKKYPTVTLEAVLAVPSQLIFGIQIPKTHNPIERQRQEDFSQLAHETFRKIKAHYGFVNYSERPDSADYSGTEYERKRNLFIENTLRDLHQLVRGAFWENYLTTEHIQKLGGIDSIRANAPCARVEELTLGEGVVLRLTEDVNNITSEKIKELEAYFRPLEPKTNTQDL